MRILHAEAKDFSAEAIQLVEFLGDMDLAEMNRDQLLRVIGDYEVLWVRLGIQIDKEILDAARRLQVVVSPTTGLDHIDLSCAGRRGIDVLSLQGETEFLSSIPATAEHTWGLLLALNRRIPAACKSVCSGQWDRHSFRGHDLKDKRLGIVGLGRLGIQVARFGQAFGMHVAAFDPYRTIWPDHVRRCERFDDLLQSSDVLSLHVPLNDETRGMMGRTQFAQLPQDAVVINTSRGDVVDPDALMEALLSHRLRGAALDVIPGEREADSGYRNRLLDYAKKNDQLLITPHLGGATFESMAATEVFMAQKLIRHYRQFKSRRSVRHCA